MSSKNDTLHKWHRTTCIFGMIFMLHDMKRFWSVFPLLSSSVLSCPGLPSPPLCCAPQSGSSGMWWPRTGQSPTFITPRPTLEVCDWEPWSQSGGVARVHAPFACPVRHVVAHLCTTMWLPAAKSATHLYICCILFSSLLCCRWCRCLSQRHMLREKTSC